MSRVELSSSPVTTPPLSVLTASSSSCCRKRCRASDIWLGCGATAVMLGEARPKVAYLLADGGGNAR